VSYPPTELLGPTHELDTCICAFAGQPSGCHVMPAGRWPRQRHSWSRPGRRLQRGGPRPPGVSDGPPGSASLRSL